MRWVGHQHHSLRRNIIPQLLNQHVHYRIWTSFHFLTISMEVPGKTFHHPHAVKMMSFLLLHYLLFMLLIAASHSSCFTITLLNSAICSSGNYVFTFALKNSSGLLVYWYTAVLQKYWNSKAVQLRYLRRLRSKYELWDYRSEFQLSFTDIYI